MTGHTDHTRQAAIEAAISAHRVVVGPEQKPLPDEVKRTILAPVVDVVLGVVPPPPDLAPLHDLAQLWEDDEGVRSAHATELRAVLAAINKMTQKGQS